MTTIQIKASSPYDVTIGSGVCRYAPEFIRNTLRDVNKIAVVTDSTVDALHAERIVTILSEATFGVEKFIFPAGEASKNLSTYASLIDFLAEKRLGRKDLILALGGGVTGDIAGFAAATYKRGIRFVQMPTTLLAMVDSSVGGKTGVDISAGKNLVGAFHQPKAVFCDLDCLATLPDKWRMDGMGEVLKYAVLGDTELFAHLEKNPLAPIGEKEISSCIDMKRRVVEADECESGMRKLLNLGHTFAHAIELLSGYGISHGHAVATGIAAAARTAKKRSLLSGSDSIRIEALVSAMGYKTRTEFSSECIVNAILSDKKVEGDAVDVILPVSIGHCIIKKISLAELTKAVSDVL